MHRAIACLVVLTLAVPSLAKTLEEVEKEVIAAMEKHKSIRCNVEMLHDVNTAMFKSKTNMRGHFESKKFEGDTYRSRIEMKGKANVEMMGKAQSTPMETLSIDDAQYQYTLTVTGQRRDAFKGRRELTNVLGGKQFFELSRKMATLKLLSDEKLGTEDCYAIEATPKTPIPTISKFVAYLDKKTGIALKISALDNQDKEVMVMKASEIQLDVEIPDDHFVFKVPKGVTLRDMTKTTTRPSSQPGGRGEKTRSASRPSPDLEAIIKQLQERKKRAQDAKK